MSSTVSTTARIGSASRAPDRAALRPGRAARVLTWIAGAGIVSSILVMIGASLVRSSWMAPPIALPGSGPPWALPSVHVPAAVVAAALWLAAILGGGGVIAGLAAVRRGARVSVRALLVAALIAVAVLTMLPPAGSTDALDYAAYGRIVTLGRSPYVMTPYHLLLTHDAFSRSVPVEWDQHVTLYGPLATVEQAVAAILGGPSTARIVFWLKLGNAIAFGAVALAADGLLRRDPAARLRAHLLWTINPLLLWGLIAAGHLDVLAAAAGLLGLLVVGGWPAGAGLMPGRRPGQAGSPPGGQPINPGLLRAVAAGVLVGMAADIKISYVLFALGLAWALRRSPAALLAAAGGALAVLLPTYTWFGPPAVKAVLSRSSNTTADNFYQLFSGPNGYVLQHLVLIAAVVVATLSALVLWRLPARVRTPPAIQPALALSVAWLFVWPYQLPWYDAMIICLLVLYPASRLDWLVLARLTAGTIALMPGSPSPLPAPLLAELASDSQVAVAPVVLLAATVGLVALCISRRWKLPAASTIVSTNSARPARM
jgi:alpha-1,6-mannosyltransferase